MDLDPNNFSTVATDVNAILHFEEKQCRIEVEFLDVFKNRLEGGEFVVEDSEAHLFMKNPQSLLHGFVNDLYDNRKPNWQARYAVLMDMHVWEANVNVRITNDGNA